MCEMTLKGRHDGRKKNTYGMFAYELGLTGILLPQTERQSLHLDTRQSVNHG
jgi:hypothetical protein